MWSGPASLYVLIALADGPRHGLGIADDIAEFSRGSVELGPATLYRCLKELTVGGFIERVYATDSPNPHRKYYRLTNLGAAELRSAVDELRLVFTTALGRVAKTTLKAE